MEMGMTLVVSTVPFRLPPSAFALTVSLCDCFCMRTISRRNIHLNNIFVTSIPSGSDVDGEYNGVLGDLRMAVDVDDLAVANDKKLDAKVSPIASADALRSCPLPKLI